VTLFSYSLFVPINLHHLTCLETPLIGTVDTLARAVQLATLIPMPDMVGHRKTKPSATQRFSELAVLGGLCNPRRRRGPFARLPLSCTYATAVVHLRIRRSRTVVGLIPPLVWWRGAEHLYSWHSLPTQQPTKFFFWVQHAFSPTPFLALVVVVHDPTPSQYICAAAMVHLLVRRGGTSVKSP
jgi:hypothetical protein